MNRVKLFVLSLALCACVAGVANPSQAGGFCIPEKEPICPAVFDPVKCDNGKIYENQCFADADCATGCESTGGSSL